MATERPGGRGPAGEPEGLTSVEVAQARARWGENRLPAQEGVPVVRLLLNQLRNPLIAIILLAAAISLLLGEAGDFAIIAVVVVADVALGFAQEFQARRTYLALTGLLKPTAKVVRDGVRVEVEVAELVPGDLVLLGAGDRTPADGVLLQVTRLAFDEAILTGESEPVTKRAAAEAPEDERAGRAFMGSTVVTGRGLLRVSDTGTRTELGAIAASLARGEEEPTPLQVRLAQFSRVLTWVVIASTATILAVGLLAGREFFGMVRTAIILAVAAVPEGLIIAVTVILVIGMRRILRRNGLVKRLLAVETLGSVTVICTDKTGTLTEGRMRVHRAELTDGEGARRAMLLCNDLEGPVDVALWEYAEGLPGDPAELLASTTRLGEEPFSSETKRMIAQVEGGSLGGRVLFAKGAPEVVLSLCDLPDADRAAWSERCERWASDGLRLIGLAQRADGALEERDGYAWLGLLGLEDPVRPGVPEAIGSARRAGIRTIMLTGDHRRTAESIAARVGLPPGEVLDGTALAALSDADLRSAVARTTVFARIRPQDKLRLVQALQANGEIAAMIGDGVNDAPALVSADIGVVVGSATDVAKESADLILLDSDFATTVAAVEEGRVIFDNIRKVVAYVLSNSFAAVLTIFGALLLGWPTPLLVGQILWINLVCDGPADIVLGFEPKEAGVMERAPRALREPILDRLGAGLIAAICLASSAGALALFGYFHLVAGDPARGRSIVFASFALNSMVYIFAYRSLRAPLWRMNPLSANKPLLAAVVGGALTAWLPFWLAPLGDLLEIVPLRIGEWALVAGIAVALLVIVEVAKAIQRRYEASGSRGDAGGLPPGLPGA